MIGRGDPRSKSFLVPTRRIRDYFPSNIPPLDSGVVHVVVDLIIRNSVTSQVNEIGTMPLEDDKPLPGEDDDYEVGSERTSRVQRALGLFVVWSISGTDFSQPHDYQGAKWLEYEGFSFGHPSRVYIGDKTTWRELESVLCHHISSQR